MSQKKKFQKKAQKKSNTFNAVALSAAALIFLVLIIVLVGNKLSPSGTNNNPLVIDNDLIIKISDISAKAQFYPVEIEGTKLEVVAVKAPDGTIRTAFNTCQVCYSSGRGYYVQEGSVLVCQNCGNRFRMSDVEVTRGGCNPVPISSEDKSVDETSITISKSYLSQAKSIFANWKD